MRLAAAKLAGYLALGIGLAACRRDAQPDEPEAEAAPASQRTKLSRVNSYAPGRWRLADPEELKRVMLWVSHILIRHNEPGNPDPAFAMADWHSASPTKERTRTEALAIANRVQKEAARDPSRFAQLAKQYSEDVATTQLGGSLGGMQAYQLLLWPQVLDALAATSPGQVSRVVETPYGFHILLRRAVPNETVVTGAHVVISHEAAGWIKIVGRDNVPVRSRSDALKLANDVYTRATNRPESFSQLVKEYSEHRDAAKNGDMGTWSTHEPTHYPREVEILGKLAVGEVAPPLDSPVGFQIIQRIPNPSRQRYAMQAVRLFFDPARFPPDPSAQATVFGQAVELASQLQGVHIQHGQVVSRRDTDWCSVRLAKVSP